ncbi:helix-turn-helix transcriptional regulator [Streptomyces sp. NPDC097619]|uniref:helix-turn-helix domain-containing protein n=1 Tax=Streptomyces sp. NPDC097619 TaxID=3157228 RepID=UPI003327B704
MSSALLRKCTECRRTLAPARTEPVCRPCAATRPTTAPAAAPTADLSLVIRTAEVLHLQANALLASAQEGESHPMLLSHVTTLHTGVVDTEAAIIYSARTGRDPWAHLAAPLGVTPERLRKRWKTATLTRRVDKIRRQQAADTLAREPAAPTPTIPDPEAVQAVPADAEAPVPRTPLQQLATAMSFIQRHTERTLVDVATDIGISPSYLSRILAGERRPKWPIVASFAAACGGHAEELRDLWEAAQRPADLDAVVRPLAPHSQEAARDKLHTTVRALLLAAGMPDYEQIAAHTGYALTAVDIQEIAYGRAIAEWPVMSQLILALGGRPAEVRALWHAAAHPPPRPPGTPVPAAALDTIRLETTVHHLRPVPRTPPAFQAFLDLHQDAYLAYARTTLTPEQAGKALLTVFTRLAAAWHTITTAPNPAERAWSTLTHTVHEHPPTPADDIATLTRLGYTPHTCATLTGLDLAKITLYTRTPHQH